MRSLPSSERPCSMLSPTRRLCSRTVTSHLQDGTEHTVSGNNLQILMLARPHVGTHMGKPGSHFSLCCLSAGLLNTSYAKAPASGSTCTAGSRGWPRTAQHCHSKQGTTSGPDTCVRPHSASKVMLATTCCACCCTCWFTADMQSSTDCGTCALAALQKAGTLDGGGRHEGASPSPKLMACSPQRDITH